jgi:hypothetical protein|tara:strand:- start:409 stop:990 length:582 start_codon:yes stop_codon:yes gene_type:complete
MSGIISDNLGRSSGLVKSAAVSSDYVKLGTGTVSDAASFTIDLHTTDYKYYEYRYRELYGATNGQTVRLRFNTSAGTAQTGSGYIGAKDGSYWNSSGASNYQKAGTWSADHLLINNNSASANELGYGIIRVYDPLTAGTKTCFESNTGGAEANHIYVKQCSGYYASNEAHTGISLYISSGNIYVGECNVYGVK